jgi:N-acetylglucosaminyl-diphospho-decaprenol L-rhamnosyltransferase
VNVGVDRTTAPYVGVFNPDGVTRPDTVARLASALEQNPQAFMAGAQVLSRTVQGVQGGGDPQVTDWLPGTAVVYRRDWFLETGGFAPGFFMYYEDVDLSRRPTPAAGNCCWSRPRSSSTTGR